MENILLKYMAERYDESKPEELNLHQLKAFITISREYGCPAKDIATILVKNINSYNEDIKINQKWNIISKEILDEAAKALNVHPDRISKFFKADKKNTIDEILTSLSVKYYHSNLKIKKTLTKIIQDFATKGNVIIVGRGGVSVTNNLKNGLHIRLFAPLEWRAEQIIENGHCNTFQDAILLAKEIDYKRNELIKIMGNNKFQPSDFNLQYNCSFFSKEEIAESILYHLILKNLIYKVK